MMSNKWAFSLTSLIIILALAFIAPAMGGVLGDKFGTSITLLGTGSTAAAAVVLGDNVTADGAAHHLRVVFDKKVDLNTGSAPDDTATDAVKAAYADDFVVADIDVMAFAKATGNPVTTPTVTIADVNADPATMTHFNIQLTELDADDTNMGFTVVVKIAADKVKNADPADVLKAATSDDTLGKNKAASLQFDVVAPSTDTPKVLDVEDLPGIVLGPGTHDSFTFKVTLSEEPKEFKKDKIDVGDHATIDSDPIALAPMIPSTATNSTEARGLVYPYLVTVKPKYESKDDIVIKIKSFENKDTPVALKSLVSMAYRVKVNSDANKLVGSPGFYYALPKDIIIPKDGYLVIAKKKADSYISDPGDAKDDTAKIIRRTEAKHQTYNLIELDFTDLEGFLIRGGTIDIQSPKAGLVITEIMWATDGGSADRQWIEIKNTSGADIKVAESKSRDSTDDIRLSFYEAGANIPAVSGRVVDRVSTLYKGTNIWPIVGKGQSGRTDEVVERKIEGKDKDVDIDIAIVPTDRLISMERVMNADGTYADGTMDGSWGESALPSRNFVDEARGFFVGSPGASSINPVADPIPEPEPEPVAPVPPAIAGDILITEIMVDTGNDRLPQWIELTNVSGKEVSLDGWSLEIENSAADTGAVGSKVSIDLTGTLGIGGGEGAGGTLGKALLLVAWEGRHSSNLEDLAEKGRVVDVSTEVGERGRYKLISDEEFMITLLPRQMTGVRQNGDEAGNLDKAWDIPMDDTGRSSLIRRAMDAAGMMTKGTDANGWVLASTTSLVDTPATWYGSDEDAGTPGVIGGGPLPVELSHFRPARDKATGAVVITWATQSELNNAGFFIKRSNQRDGEFKIISPTMIPGAGTTSEKQFYTYTDTTAQPNIVYYYQIEDVSLDGNRQTLTRGIRLKGHIGAAGKLTSTWGELKSSNE